jgi:5-methylcytosine-specific restriction endonuclease McrA
VTRTVCSYPGCPVMASNRDRCAAHPRRRNSGALRRMRETVVLRDHGVCQDCGLLGTVVHHLDPVRLGGPHTPANGVLLCDACHSFRERAPL